MRKKITDRWHCLLIRLLIISLPLLIGSRAIADSNCTVNKTQVSLVHDVCDSGIQLVKPFMAVWGDWWVSLHMCYQYQVRRDGREIEGLWLNKGQIKRTLEKMVSRGNDVVRNSIAIGQCQKNDIDCMEILFHNQMVEMFSYMKPEERVQCIVSYHIDSGKTSSRK